MSSEGQRSAICLTCGAKSVEYTFHFNEGLAVFLIQLARSPGGIAKTNNLGLTYSQRTNSQKLRYWNLAEAYLNEEGKVKRGWWKITPAGRRFAEGTETIPERVVMCRNQWVRFDGGMIHIFDAWNGWHYRSHYADQAKKQMTLGSR